MSKTNGAEHSLMNLARGCTFISQWPAPEKGGCDWLIVMTPDSAKQFFDAGWTKQDVKLRLGCADTTILAQCKHHGA
jgi:hypothetical protein